MASLAEEALPKGYKELREDCDCLCRAEDLFGSQKGFPSVPFY